MSADAWKVCPRCLVNNDIGLRGNEFREDYAIGLDEETNMVTVEYHGECQRCGLTMEFADSRPLVFKNEPNLTIPRNRRPWCQIPAGWFVENPKDGTWLEVLATIERDNQQDVTLRLADGLVHTWPRPANSSVWCVPGTMPSAAGHAIRDAFNTLAGTFPAVQIIEDQVD